MLYKQKAIKTNSFIAFNTRLILSMVFEIRYHLLLKVVCTSAGFLFIYFKIKLHCHISTIVYGTWRYAHLKTCTFEGCAYPEAFFKSSTSLLNFNKHIRNLKICTFEYS